MDFAGLEILAQTLSTGFEALLAEVRSQRQIEKALREKISYAAIEYTNLHYSLGYEFSANSSEVLDRLEKDLADNIGADVGVPLKNPLPGNPEVERAWQAWKTLQKGNQAKEDVRRPVLRKCPITRQTTDQEEFEHDFTTPGARGSLECPFAKMAANGLPATPNSTVDPIAAEFHRDKISVVSPDAAAEAAGKCPIRFLDQHSPEEVAKYFENHKHEIPRSHEVCVKRYQANEHSIRELDEKYGNLVNMIQGLGVKHKQYLPEKDGDDEHSQKRDPSSTRAVEKWAEDVNQKPEDIGPDPGYEADEEERIPHFEKPLREIRVGESPSRPWGIQIPVEEEAARSVSEPVVAVRKPHSALLDNADEAVTSSCPFGRGKKKQKVSVPVSLSDDKDDEGDRSQQDEDHNDAKTGRRRPQSNRAGRHQIVFNGPVFLGYAPEQAMAMLEAWKGK